MLEVTRQCPVCGTMQSVEIPTDIFAKLMNRTEMIQTIWPDSTPAQRELFQSGMCQACWDKL